MNEMMAREIAAQAEILPDCVEPLAQRIASIAPPKGRILAGGCGDSVFAPAALGKVFGALGLEVTARTSMALAGFTRTEPGDTVILSSISGGTRRTLDAAVVARAQGARLIALTCKDGSPLANAADDTIILPFSPLSRKTPHTLDYSVTLLALTMLVLAWSGRQASEISPVLDVIPRLIDRARHKVAGIAAQMTATGKLFILGAGPELGSAEYGAAKFHEAGGIVAIAAETENFVHGMNFMVEPDDTILALAGNAPGLHRGREVIGQFRDFVACAALIEPGLIEADAFTGRDYIRAFADLLSVTFVLQHLCLAFADRQGLALEQPRAGRAYGDAHLAIQSKIMAT